MIKISSSNITRTIINLLILVAVAKLISLVLMMLLPKSGVELKESQSYKPKYQRVTFENMLNSSTTTSSITVGDKEEPSGINITNMLLKGLYGDKKSGFAIVALKATPEKTSIIGVGEYFSGYKLVEILKESVVFRKNSKNYILKIKKLPSTDAYVKPVDKKSDDNVQNVSKGDLSFYLDDPKRIWSDISITEVKSGKKIKGFKINNIKGGSKISKLGLKKGDVIIRANNIELNSYKAAFSIFNDIKNISTMQIVVLRNKKEKEFVYEIN